MKKTRRMTTVTRNGKTLGIPDMWLMVRSNALQREEGLDFKEAYAAAIDWWFEQEEMEQQFRTEHNITS